MIGFLVLESGEVFAGSLFSESSEVRKDLFAVKDFEKKFSRAGEVVFNTSHFGYEEIATDPSYFSQIVVITAPQQGNYGVNDDFWESRRIWIEGFVCLQTQYSEREQSWIKRLHESQVPILTGLDTRMLTMHLRKQGTPWGAVVIAKDKEEAKVKAKVLIDEKKKIQKDWVFEVSRKETETQTGEIPFGPKVAVLDFGVKENILRQLKKYASEIRIFNSRTSFDTIASYKPEALMLTNGPGDPADVQQAAEVVKPFIGQIPIFGICMGHQILSLALGAKTYKLKFGHRGSNHPIQDLLLKKIYVSSQNHGYAVDEKTLPKDVIVTQRNLNDQTVAGFYSQERNFLGIQYHPEACPGPHEASELFKYFFEEMILNKKNRK